MPARHRIFLLAVLILAAALACRASDWSDVRQELDLPTPAPTPAPAEEHNQQPESPTPGSQPQTAEAETIAGVGQKISYAASGGAACPAGAELTLVIQPDGRAALNSTGPSIVDHYNCTAGSSEETWYVEGKTDPASQMVIFETCNFGGFSAAGSFSYAGNQLSGEVSCFNKQGEKTVSFNTGK